MFLKQIEQIKTVEQLEQYYYILEEWKLECNWNNFKLNVNSDKGKRDFIRIINNNNFCLLGLIVDNKRVGVLGLTTFTSAFSDDKIANEHYWYVLKDYRKYSLFLLYEAEKWARENECSHLIVNASYLASDLTSKVIEVYKKRNFKEFEASFIKYLGE